MRHGRWIAAGALSLVAAAVGYRAGFVRADGIPATSPLYYAGYLEEAGRPVEGSRNIVVYFWTDATSMDSDRLACRSPGPGTAVSGGRFRVVLDNRCAAAVRSTPDLWVEVEVNGTGYGRSKIGAVPFAIEASRASDLTQSARDSLVPPGSMLNFAGATAPEGWLLCDGRAVSRSTYRRLFEVIGTSWGSGDGAATFNLPDLRGRFVRGVDNGAGRDPDRAGREASATGGNTGDRVGTVQGHAFASHTHGASTSAMRFDRECCGGDIAHIPPGDPAPSWDGRGAGVDIASTGGSETRPANVSAHFIIKF